MKTDKEFHEMEKKEMIATATTKDCADNLDTFAVMLHGLSKKCLTAVGTVTLVQMSIACSQMSKALKDGVDKIK